MNRKKRRKLTVEVPPELRAQGWLTFDELMQQIDDLIPKDRQDPAAEEEFFKRQDAEEAETQR